MARTAMITGAGGGLAQATARLLAQAGWSLALVGRDGAALAAVERDLQEDTPTPPGAIRIVLVEADVRDGEGAVTAVETARALIGSPLAALVHCAGATVLPAGPAAAAGHADAAARAADAAFFTLGAYVDQMLADGTGGRAVLVTTSAMPAGRPRDRAIAAAERGIAALVQAAAATWAAHGLRINAIAPGLVRCWAGEREPGNARPEKALSEQYPLGRWGDVLDTARAIGFLLGEDASWLSGQVVPLDGGYTTLRQRLPMGAPPA